MGHILKCHEIVKTDFVRAENCYLFDVQGRRYIDFESGIWCTALGHNHPRITQIISKQLSQIMHLGTRYPNRIAEESAIEVLEITEINEGKCVFLSSGNEAVEFGVQAVRKLSGKDRLLTFQNSFLGSYGSAGIKRENEWLLLDWNDLDETDLNTKLDQIPFEELGGFVFEPGGSGIGFVHFPPKYLIEEICCRVKQAGGVVAVNEVTTGMGRTGKWFGFQHYDIQPDIVSIGKGLGNGYPVSSVAMTQEIAESLESKGIRYAQSHQNDPLGCAVAREVITVMREENWIEIGASKGEFFLQGLKQLVDSNPTAQDARGRGMLLALELAPHDQLTAESAYLKMLENGFLIGYYPAANLLRFDPSLTIEKESIQSLLNGLDKLLKSY